MKYSVSVASINMYSNSPLAAYDLQSDRFLLLDVARYKYPAYWVKTEDLWNAVNTKDDNTYRGFIMISP